MTKELLIITLILVVIYLAYQQNQQPNILTTSAHSSQLTQLAQERNHYQTLYQNLVKKDLANDQTQKIQQLTTNLAGEREAKILYQQKVGDLETSLLNLAKNKLTGKKEYLKLVEQMENNFKAKTQQLTLYFTNQRDNLLNKLNNYLAKL